MAGLTAKVFRTFNASHTFQSELLHTPENGTISDKVLAFNRSNRRVAVLCNHQRTVSKGHGGQMEKLDEKVSDSRGSIDAWWWVRFCRLSTSATC